MDFFHCLLTLSIEKKYDLLVRNLSEFKSKNFFKVNSTEMEALLFSDDLDIHSLLFLHIIDNVPWSVLQRSFYRFLIIFDVEQVLHSMKKFYEAVESFVKFCIENNIVVKIIKPLFLAVKKFEAYGITPLHNLYLQVCLRTKMYKEGLKVAYKPVGSLSRKTGTYLNLND